MEQQLDKQEKIDHHYGEIQIKMNINILIKVRLFVFFFKRNSNNKFLISRPRN